MRRKLRTIILIMLALALALGGFWLLQQQQKSQEVRKTSIVFISKRLAPSHDFWTSIVEGVQMAATDYGADLTIMGPDSETEIERQNEMIEEAIEMKPDAIVLIPSDVKLTVPYAREIEAAGIKLILMDSVMDETMGLCVVATDNRDGGYKMGEYLKYYADEETVIGIVGHIPEASTAIEREQGVREGLGEYADRIVDVVYGESDIAKGQTVTLEMLDKYPEINMLVGLNEDSARGAANALKEREISDKVRLIGFDSSMEQVRLLEEGVFNAIVVQKPFNMGYLGAEMAVKAAIGEKIPESVDSGSALITKDNLYTKENEKLIFPFRGND